MSNAVQMCNTKDQIRLILLGHGTLAIRLLESLVSTPDLVNIAGLMPASALRGHKSLVEHPLEKALLKLAKDKNIHIVDAPSANSPTFLSSIERLSANVVLVGGWPEILKRQVIEKPNLTLINCHGSLLPKYRGACPCIAAVFNGDIVTGFTYHLIDGGVDTGDILFQQEVEVKTGETGIELLDRIAGLFGETVPSLLQDYFEGRVVPRKQVGASSYVPKCDPAWGWIQWEMDPPVIDSRMRAVEGVLPLATSLYTHVIGFEKGKVARFDSAMNICKSTSMARYRTHLKPGVVIDNDGEKIMVATRDPNFCVELYAPVLAPQGQPIPIIRPGDPFVSADCKSILRSAG